MDSYGKLNTTLNNNTRIFLCYEVVIHVSDGPKKVDRIILMSLFFLTAIFIIILNAYMFNFLRRKDRKRANIQFMILTFSDLINGMISLPIVTLKFINFGVNVNCKLRAFVQFAYLFPLTYSWLITVGICIDRLIVISISQTSEVLMDRLNLLYRVCCLLFCLFASIKTAYILWQDSSKAMTFEESSKRTVDESGMYQLIGEVSVVLVICILQLILVYNVNRKARAMNQHRQGATSYDKKVTKTVNLLIFFTILTTTPRLIIYGMQFYYPLIVDKRMRSGYYLIHFGVLSVHFNSLFSAIVLITRTNMFKDSVGKQKKVNPNKIGFLQKRLELK